jgi:hypothetical protein
MPNITEFSFGNACVRKLSEAESGKITQASLPQNSYRYDPINRSDYAQFRWLVVRENVKVESNPIARAPSFLDTPIKADYGEFSPHEGKFPREVENATFFMLLAPWEDWIDAAIWDW